MTSFNKLKLHKVTSYWPDQTTDLEQVIISIACKSLYSLIGAKVFKKLVLGDLIIRF